MKQVVTKIWPALILLGATACNLPVGTSKPSSGDIDPIVIYVSATPADPLPGFIPQIIGGNNPTSTASPEASATPLPPTSTDTAIPPTDTPIPPTDTPIPPTATPYGCQRPSDDVTRVRITDGVVVNQRTLTMLETAQNLYGGSHIFAHAITQGSYNTSEEASFGTHDGGGAVDISVRDLSNWNNILYDEFPAIILALRQAGFAAWVRDSGELYPDSPIHIHAIAIGDPELSQAAKDQLTGTAGYFRGFNGLPVDPPVPDAYGGPYLCPWMQEMGYSDLR